MYDMRMMNWNLGRGGFKAYSLELAEPVRGPAIQGVIRGLHEDQGVTSAGLIDAYRWDDTYGGNEGIASHLGFKEARFVRLEDAMFASGKVAGIGVAFATDEPIARTDVLDLARRKALGVVLDIGKHGLQVAVVYLEHMSEERRCKQFAALHAELQKDVPTTLMVQVPTLLVGDFNSLRRDLRGMSLRHRAGDLAVRVAARVVPNRKHLREQIAGMNERRLVPQIESCWYIDADNQHKRPTAPAMLPVFGVDYVFRKGAVSVDNLRPLRRREIKGASDHLPLVYDVHVA